MGEEAQPEYYKYVSLPESQYSTRQILYPNNRYAVRRWIDGSRSCPFVLIVFGMMSQAEGCLSHLGAGGLAASKGHIMTASCMYLAPGAKLLSDRSLTLRENQKIAKINEIAPSQ